MDKYRALSRPSRSTVPRLIISLLFLFSLISVGCKDDPAGPEKQNPQSAFQVSPEQLDFKLESRSLEVSVTNTGNAAGDFTVSEDCSWVTSVEPSSGSLSGGQSVSISVTISRDGLTPGRKEARLGITTSSGELGVGVFIDVPQQEPILLFFESWEGLLWRSRWLFEDRNSGDGEDGWGRVYWPDAARDRSWVLRAGATGDHSGGYDDYMNAVCELKPEYTIDISEYTDVRVVFQMAYHTEVGHDRVYFEIVNGGTWYYKDAYTWSGPDWFWRPRTIEQGAWNHWDSKQLRFRFKFTSDGSNSSQYYGALIDPVEVWARPRVYTENSAAAPVLAAEPESETGGEVTLPYDPSRPPGTPVDPVPSDPAKPEATRETVGTDSRCDNL